MIRSKITSPVFGNKVIPDFPGPFRCYINYTDLDSISSLVYVPSYLMNSVFNFIEYGRSSIRYIDIGVRSGVLVATFELIPLWLIKFISFTLRN
jgi:hypothetical protein